MNKIDVDLEQVIDDLVPRFNVCQSDIMEFIDKLLNEPGEESEKYDR